MFRVFKITGDSMLPTLGNGDYVLALCWKYQLKIGHLVIAKHPDYGLIVKRICELVNDDQFLLSGDNTISVNHQQIGIICRAQIIGRVIYSVKKN